jgi:hypothetical protein
MKNTFKKSNTKLATLLAAILMMLTQSCAFGADPDDVGPVSEKAYYVYFTINPTNGKTLDYDGAYEDSNGDNLADLTSGQLVSDLTPMQRSNLSKYDYVYNKVIVTGYKCYVDEYGTVTKTMTPTDVATKINSNLPIGVPILIKKTGTRYVDNIQSAKTGVVNTNMYTTTFWVTANW